MPSLTSILLFYILVFGKFETSNGEDSQLNSIFRVSRSHGCGSSFDYSENGLNGPLHWPTLYPQFCSKDKQSPINIKTEDTVKKGGCPPFKLTGYDVAPKKIKIVNNGHSAQAAVEYEDAATKPSVSGGCLTGPYEFVQMHWHWGSDATPGSEHTIDDKRFPMEFHMVHFKKEYGSVSNALTKPDGLAVLGVLLEAGTVDNAAHLEISKVLRNIKKPQAVTYVEKPMSLRSFLPDQITEFYRYQGSLTTPKCNEVVVWTVFKNTVKMQTPSLQKFNKLMDSCGHQLINNFRPTQKLNGRKVYNFKTK